MSLSSIASDIQNAAESGGQWLKEITDTHLPAILELAAKYENNPIVQALEGAVLPPEDVAVLVSLINRFVVKPAAEQPQQPVAA